MTIIGISGLVIALLTIDCLVQHPNDVARLRSRFTAFRIWYMDKNNPWPVWIFTLGFIAVMIAFFN